MIYLQNSELQTNRKNIFFDGGINDIDRVLLFDTCRSDAKKLLCKNF